MLLPGILLLVQIQAFPDASYSGNERRDDTDQGTVAQTDPQARQIEPGKPVERELAGGQSHAYQLVLAAGQYLNLVVDQRGIDVAVRMSGPDGKALSEFDSETRMQGPEAVTWVAEAAGSYRFDVRAKQKDAAAGRYEIKVAELRAATESDRSLVEARNLYIDFVRLFRAGKHDEARPLIERSLEIRERILGPEHMDVAVSINGLAALYSEKGDYVKTEPLYQRALAIMEKTVGPEHLGVANTLNNLANIYRERGDFNKAESFYWRALVISEKVMGPEHPSVGMSLNNLAAIYLKRADFDKAEPLYRRALAIREKELGPEHPRFADSLNNLALLYSDKGDFDKAEPIYRRALAIMEKALGPEHFNVAAVLNNLATGYRKKGDYAKAEPPYQRALAIREKALGPEHPLVTFSLNELAMLNAAKGDTAQAITILSRANAISERNLALNLAAGSERQKLAYLSLFSKQTNLTLSLHSRAAPDNQQALNLALTTLLRRKGRGLDATTDTIATLRRHATPEDQALLDQLAEARSQLADLTLKESGATRPDIYRERFKPLAERIEKLEVALSSRSTEFRVQSQPVTLAAVQAAVPDDSILIEFAVYDPLDPQTEKSKPPRYLAYLLAAQGPPRWIDLGEAAVIDRAVAAWRRALRNPKRTDVKRLARTVDEKVMWPVRSTLSQIQGETRRLLIAPDSRLNLIPFAALVDRRNRYLVERYAISYLTSGRDLLRLQTSEPSKSGPLVVANPDFGGLPQTAIGRSLRLKKSTSKTQPEEVSAGSAFNQFYFPSLPSTAEEGEAVRSLLPGARLLTQKQASKAALSQIRSPLLLHIATHGFFLEDPNPASRGEQRNRAANGDQGRSKQPTERNGIGPESALLRSGLALAGANEQKKDDNGILTALEVAGLDLWGTKLVVLSACDTGVGYVKKGEGVQGLRRALVLAGSESQIISLWPVRDKATKELMIPYYKALRQGTGRNEGLRQVQLRMLQSKNRRHPFYWAAFIQSGEWANLEGKR